MSDHTCQAVVVTCIDFRFQGFINQWIKEHFHDKDYDRVALAGGVFNLEQILKQIEVSHRLHHIKQVILINHEDCGAYGTGGTPERHTADLRNAATKINGQFPTLAIDTYYLHLDGQFEKID